MINQVSGDFVDIVMLHYTLMVEAERVDHTYKGISILINPNTKITVLKYELVENIKDLGNEYRNN